MSIWSSWETIGFEDFSHASGVIMDGEVYPAVSHWVGNGEVRSYAHGWSNHYPNGDAEHPASIDLASIPPWCVPGHEDDNGSEDWPIVGPWLRLAVESPLAMTLWRKDDDGNPTPQPESATVVLDEQAVRTLRDQLTEWLDQPKAYPRTEHA